MDQLAPTPIYRITSEQLDQLVKRIAAQLRKKDRWEVDRDQWYFLPPVTALTLTTPKMIVGENFYRRGLVVAAQSQAVVMAPDAAPVSTSAGIQLSPTAGPTLLTYEDWGHALCHQWWASAVSVGGLLVYAELVATIKDR